MIKQSCLSLWINVKNIHEKSQAKRPWEQGRKWNPCKGVIQSYLRLRGCRSVFIRMGTVLYLSLFCSLVWLLSVDLIYFSLLQAESQDRTVWRHTESQAVSAQTAEGWEGGCEWKQNLLHLIYSHVKRNHVLAVWTEKVKAVEEEIACFSRCRRPEMAVWTQTALWGITHPVDVCVHKAKAQNSEMFLEGAWV